MTLLPPPDDVSDVNLEGIIRKIQKHAGPEGYTVIKKRTKNGRKSNLPYKAWLRCDKGGKIRTTISQKRIVASQVLEEVEVAIGVEVAIYQ